MTITISTMKEVTKSLPIQSEKVVNPDIPIAKQILEPRKRNTVKRICIFSFRSAYRFTYIRLRSSRVVPAESHKSIFIRHRFSLS
jgi:hypothetical protein